jgi:Zn-dependent peptidase ImmA (M78 family)
VRRAELAAESLRRVIDRDDGRLAPVDLRAAAEYLGVTVLSWQPEENESKGALIRSARAAFVNASLSLPRTRFTIAHELGHFVLGHNGDYYCPSCLYAAREREANRFAAAFLMPAPLVKSLWLKLDGLPPGAKARLVAERLAVSREALGYRLVTLGLGARALAAGRGA